MKPGLGVLSVFLSSLFPRNVQGSGFAWLTTVYREIGPGTYHLGGPAPRSESLEVTAGTTMFHFKGNGSNPRDVAVTCANITRACNSDITRCGAPWISQDGYSHNDGPSNGVKGRFGVTLENVHLVYALRNGNPCTYIYMTERGLTNTSGTQIIIKNSIINATYASLGLFYLEQDSFAISLDNVTITGSVNNTYGLLSLYESNGLVEIKGSRVSSLYSTSKILAIYGSSVTTVMARNVLENMEIMDSILFFGGDSNNLTMLDNIYDGISTTITSRVGPSSQLSGVESLFQLNSSYSNATIRNNVIKSVLSGYKGIFYVSSGSFSTLSIENLSLTDSSMGFRNMGKFSSHFMGVLYMERCYYSNVVFHGVTITNLDRGGYNITGPTSSVIYDACQGNTLIVKNLDLYRTQMDHFIYNDGEADLTVMPDSSTYNALEFNYQLVDSTIHQLDSSMGNIGISDTTDSIVYFKHHLPRHLRIENVVFRNISHKLIQKSLSTLYSLQYATTIDIFNVTLESSKLSGALSDPTTGMIYIAQTLSQASSVRSAQTINVNIDRVGIQDVESIGNLFFEGQDTLDYNVTVTNSTFANCTYNPTSPNPTNAYAFFTFEQSDSAFTNAQFTLTVSNSTFQDSTHSLVAANTPGLHVSMSDLVVTGMGKHTESDALISLTSSATPLSIALLRSTFSNISAQDIKPGIIGAGDSSFDLIIDDCYFTNIQPSDAGAIMADQGLVSTTVSGTDTYTHKITNSWFELIKPTTDGGILDFGDHSHVTRIISGCLFQNISASTISSTIIRTSNSLSIFNTVFKHISGKNGAVASLESAGTITVSHCTFENIDGDYGTLFYLSADANVNISMSTLADISAVNAGCISYSSGTSEVQLQDVTASNMASDIGTAYVHLQSNGNVILKRSMFTNGNGLSGFNVGSLGTMIVESCTFDTSSGTLFSMADSSTISIKTSSFYSITSEQMGGVIFMYDYGTITISNSTFIGIDAVGNGGLAYVLGDSVSMSVTDCNIQDVTALSGGLVWIWKTSTLEITNCNINGVQATLDGGLLYIMSTATATIKSSSIQGCTAGNGGVFGCHKRATVRIQGSTLHLNNATKGGIGHMTDSSTAIIKNSIITSSFAKTSGAFSLEESASLTIKDTTLRLTSSETAVMSFGEQSSLSISDSVISESFGSRRDTKANVFTFTDRSSATMERVTVSSNTVGSTGSVIEWESFDSLSISDSKFTSNSGASTGGVLMITYDGTISVSNSVFTDNNSTSHGGAIYSTEGVTTVENCTFKGQRSAGSGGAIYGMSNAVVKVRKSTFTSNVAYYNGGGVMFLGISINISASTFTSNKAGDYGGAISTSGVTTIQVSDSQIFYNIAGTKASAHSSTFFYLRPKGGGIHLISAPTSAQYSIFNCTVMFNQAINGSGGGFYADFASAIPYMSDSIFLNNTAIHGPNKASHTHSVSWNVSGLEVEGSASIPYAIVIELLDYFGNRAVLDSISSTLLSSNVGIISNDQVTVSNGVACFGFPCQGSSSSTVVYSPNETVTLSAKVTIVEDESETTFIRYPPSGEVSILPCQAGQARLLSSCEDCRKGTYMDSVPQEVMSCTECAPGSYASSTRSINCTVCEEGKVATSRGSSSCQSCPQDFIPNKAHTACESCPTNGVGNTSNTWQCYCSAGFYGLRLDSSGNPESCESCPLGGICTAIATTVDIIMPQEGYWRDFNVEEKASFIECVNQACLGETNDCSTGYTGMLCSVCEDGYGRQGEYDCVKCPGIILNAFRLAGAYIAVMAAGVILTYVNVDTAQRSVEQGLKDLNGIDSGRSAIVLKILLNSIQFNSIAATFKYKWPKPVEFMLTYQAVGGNSMTALMNVDCAVQDTIKVRTFYLDTLIIALVPLFVPFLAWLSVLLADCLSKRNKNNAGDRFEGVYALPEDGDPQNLEKREKKGKYQTAVMSLLFALYPSLVLQAFKLFNCQQLGETSESFVLMADMREICHQGSQLTWMLFLGVPMVVVYVLGFPIICLILLNKFKHILPTRWTNEAETWSPYIRRKKQLVAMKLYLLFHGYKPNFYYFEVVIMVRKLLVVAIAVFFHDQLIQALLATLLVVIVMTIQVRIMPFTGPILNILEFYSLATSFVTFFFGLFLFGNIGYEGEVCISIIILGANIVFYCGGFYLFYRDIVRETKMEKMMKNERLDRKLDEKFKKKSRYREGRGQRMIVINGVPVLQPPSNHESEEEDDSDDDLPSTRNCKTPSASNPILQRTRTRGAEEIEMGSVSKGGIRSKGFIRVLKVEPMKISTPTQQRTPVSVRVSKGKEGKIDDAQKSSKSLQDTRSTPMSTPNPAEFKSGRSQTRQTDGAFRKWT
ncbi:hypothetical protein AAMO2058_000605300 [Amorphochlora amoebiformis]